jgi:glycosyltransferase involved in cell wall biosynthesis
MKVSIVTPSYQQGQYIERTLKSVASQTGAEIEHVVFDGGSTDSTVEILKRFNSQVRWISKKDNGQADAVNKAICATDGEIIGWLNSDDIYYPGAISRVVAYFAEHESVDVLYGMADHIDIDENILESYPTEPWNFERLKEVCFICQPALFFRRKVVKTHGLLDESLNYSMDYQYWLRLGKAGVRFGYIGEKLAGSRLYADNKTISARVKVHREINEMLKNLFGRVPERWLFNYAHAVAESKIDRNKHHGRFVMLLIIFTIFAFLRWNGNVSGKARNLMKSWIMDIIPMINHRQLK